MFYAYGSEFLRYDLAVHSKVPLSIALLNVRFHNAEFQALMITFFSFRTAINVLGDSIGAGLVYHLSKEELENIKKGAMEGGFEALPMTEIEDNENK